MTDLAFCRLRHTLDRIMEPGTKSHSQEILEAMADAWLVVDSTHRLRGLVQQLPGLKQNQVPVQIFLRSTEPVERLRNFVQHLREEIKGVVETKLPLWGTLSWNTISPSTGEPRGHIIIPGSVFPDLEAVTVEFDRQEWRFVEGIVLHAGRTRVDLTAIFDRVAAFCRWFEEWHRNSLVDATKHHFNGGYVAFDVSAVLWKGRDDARSDRPPKDETSDAEQERYVRMALTISRRRS
jgi:hypothetical protein